VLFRFGPFEVHSQSGELRKNGIRIRLSGQPLRILLLLLSRPGEVVTREQLRQQTWGDGTFVDFEGGLNAAINRLRRALNDSAENPHYVETLPGRGYRFIGVLEPAAPSQFAPPAVPSKLAPPASGAEPQSAKTGYPRQRLFLLLAAAACVIIVFVAAERLRTARSSPIQWKFTQLTADGEYSDSPAISRDGKLMAYSSEKNGMRDLFVKQISGGQPIRLTFDGAGNTMPDFSPDGSKIVFRSNRDGGGIYEIAAFGGEARQLARDGLDPKYSPDGTKLAFWIGTDDLLPTIPGSGTVWVIPSAGGQPLRVGARLTTARHPIWWPGGRGLLVIGYSSDKLSEASALDWWTISSHGDVVAKAGIRDALLAAGLQSPGGDYNPQTKITDPAGLPYPVCWLADPNRVIFSARSGDARNLWSAQISSEGKMAAAIQRLTAGAVNEANGSCGSSDTFVLEKKTFARNLWSLPFDLDRAKTTGPAVQLTHGPSTIREAPSVSADGQRVAFDMLKSSVLNVWVHDVASGKETQLAPSSFTQRYPVINASGDRVAYSTYENDKRILYLAAPGGVPEKLCEGCIRPTDWSRDGKKLLLFRGSPYQVSLLDVASHQQTTLLTHPTYSLVLAHFSPDNRWVSFTARVKPNRAWIMIAPIDGPLPVPEGSWIKVSEDNEAEDAGIWSPDGKIVYFTSSHDGHTCLWARRIDPSSHQPVGEAFAVQHFHERPIQPLRIWAPAAGHIVVSLTEDTSSIWMMSHPSAR
jgi:Tol biopolymer transport system component/DNA-binding winged helix-turn-helix (wHTH) protein